MKSPRVAVLGAGIMGSSAALLLARQGVQVTLFDADSQPFNGASRWNEGKIHLGYMYSADPGMGTASRILPGGLLFKRLTEALIGMPIDEAFTRENDTYLYHRDSVVSPDAIEAYIGRMDDIIRSHPDANAYPGLSDTRRSERMSERQLRRISPSRDILAGFSIPERSINTCWLADRFVEALVSTPGIQLSMQHRITGVQADNGDGSRWRVFSGDRDLGAFDVVINALWENRLSIDQTAGLAPPPRWSHRFRRALFIRTRTPVDLPSCILCVGPFGDIKNYNGHDLYLSWYPEGLDVYGTDISPPLVQDPDASVIPEKSRRILDRLQAFLPDLAVLENNIERIQLKGGWVYAAGQGHIGDIKASLHKRSDFGIEQKGSYFSIDTGKYSTAPWLAYRLAERMATDNMLNMAKVRPGMLAVPC
jgi:glycine/D-amino acid oxidase-like deaminating enzyme